MPLKVQPFPFQLDGLGDWLAASLPMVERKRRTSLEPRKLELIGPFPAYYLDARAFMAAGPEGARRTGWRALARTAKVPVALVEITLTPGGEPRYATRGREAAAAFERALTVVAEADAAEQRELRWLSLAELYVTAVWLCGPPHSFVPTRLGHSRRARSRELTLEEMQKRVGRLLAGAERSRQRDKAGVRFARPGPGSS